METAEAKAKKKREREKKERKKENLHMVNAIDFPGLEINLEKRICY